MVGNVDFLRGICSCQVTNLKQYLGLTLDKSHFQEVGGSYSRSISLTFTSKYVVITFLKGSVIKQMTLISL